MTVKRLMSRARAATLVLLACVPDRSAAQSVTRRTPNLSNGWPPGRGVVQFNCTHRFDVSDAPLRKVTNTPSFQVATGVAGPFGVGFTYGCNSDLVPAYPNEWEWFARWSPVSQDAGALLDASLQAGWDVASESIDAELSMARQFTVPITVARYGSRRAPRGPITGSEPPHPDAQTEAAKLNPDTVVVTIRNLRYMRDTITVNVGDVVVWRNADQLDHTVTSDASAFESPAITPGKEWSHRLTAPGTYTYHCKPHPFMKGVIRVLEVKS
jgi:plastocyanin